MIGFVVLHYLAEEMTVQCAEALLGLYGDKHIVLVDNASPNGSGARLAARYQDNPSVSVLLSPHNEGFARGNNRGYAHLREHFSCHFIVVLNNDVLIRDKDFPAKVQVIYEKTPFAVLGPDILNPNTDEHQNPSHLEGFTRKELEERIAKYQNNLQHFEWNHLKWRIKQCFRPAPPQAPKPWQTPVEDAVLHGACFVFSSDYISKRPLCFNPDTFLYFEEEILHYECQQDGLKLRYDPDVQVLHLEDVATNQAFRSSLWKEKMIQQETLHSMQVLLNLMTP